MQNTKERQLCTSQKILKIFLNCRKKGDVSRNKLKMIDKEGPKYKVYISEGTIEPDETQTNECFTYKHVVYKM